MYWLALKDQSFTYGGAQRTCEQIDCQIMNFSAKIMTHLLLIYCKQTCQQDQIKISGLTSVESLILNQFRHHKQRFLYVCLRNYFTTLKTFYLQNCSVHRLDLKLLTFCSN